MGRKRDKLQALKHRAKKANHKNAFKSTHTRDSRIKLKSAQFRWINEQLYTSPAAEAQKMFKEAPQLFKSYHQGFRQQVLKWPVNPVDVIITDLRERSDAESKLVVADLGCGEAKIARSFASDANIDVKSFDLVAANSMVTACDISKVPLASESVDMAVFCLSLMGIDFVRFLIEANRILRLNGTLRIAEVESRFLNVDAFVTLLSTVGFELTKREADQKYFLLFSFEKRQRFEGDADTVVGEGAKVLKACRYKKR